jgi:8-oxo-dGTP pyrophosphatase MutT (NUDIX family)
MPSAELVKASLLDFEPASQTERSFKDRMLSLCATKAPFSRHQFEPGHFTASAFILSANYESLLLIHHAKLHRWLQPGGHVELADESLLAAATREAMEECSLKASDLELLSSEPFDLDIHRIPARKAEPEHEHFDVRFLFRCRTDRASAGDEVLDLAYVAFEHINAVESDPSVMRAVKRLQAMEFNATP